MFDVASGVCDISDDDQLTNRDFQFILHYVELTI